LPTVKFGDKDSSVSKGIFEVYSFVQHSFSFSSRLFAMECDGLRWNAMICDDLRLIAMTVATDLSFASKKQSETSLSMPLKIFTKYRRTNFIIEERKLNTIVW
jgi:hypothetical protein